MAQVTGAQPGSQPELTDGDTGAAVQTLPAPAAVALSSVSVTVTWDAVTVNGAAVASYTVEVAGLDGAVCARQTPTTNSVVLSALVPGWTYRINVWANGGPVAPPHATLEVTV